MPSRAPVSVALHDVLDIPGWTNGSRVQELVGRRTLWLATAINSLFPALAVAFVIYFWNRPNPQYVENYWLIYCAVTLLSAIAMWYIPYFFGATEKQKREYESTRSGTIQVLPPRGDNPRPNLLHLCFHVLFVMNMALVTIVRFGK